jgi:Undecaprenyl-phosphate glucose phosphotransferase
VFSLHFLVTRIESLFLVADGEWKSLKTVFGTYMSGCSALFFYRGGSYSRLLLGFSMLILVAEVGLLRTIVRSIVKHSGQQLNRVRIIMIGADDFARKTSERLRNSKVAPCKTVAFVRIPGQTTSAVEDGVPVLEMEQVMSRNLKHLADNMVLVVSPEILPLLSGLIGQLKDLAIPIRFCMDFGTDVRVGERFFRIGGTHMLDVCIAPSETISYIILKRCFDIAFSLLVLVVAGVPMALIALLVKLTSEGPALFAQERVGINGQVFKMLKFRTMKVAPAAESDTRWTIADDTRRTALGKILRRTSMDELPQFFNVLTGKMSVVGPRPERPHFVEKFNDEINDYNSRHHLKSGITGWAQVNGLRGDTDIAKRLELDIYYLKNWSFIFDLRIILMTVFSGLFAQNAY